MERTTLFADVTVPLGVPNRYTYRVPIEMNSMICRGQRVLVQFGKNKFYTGIVYSVHENPPIGYTAKYIDSILDERPIVNDIQLKLWDWIAFYYCAYPGDVMNAALPSGLKLNSTSHIQLNPDFNFEECEHDHFSQREHELLDALHNSDNLSFDDAARVLSVKSAHPIINNLLKKNAIVVYEEVKDKYKPKFESFVRLHEDYRNETTLGKLLDQLEKKAFRQAEAMLLFLQLERSNNKVGDWIRKSDLLKRCEAAAVNALVKKGVITEEQFETGRLLFEKSTAVIKSLSDEQIQACQKIRQEFSENKTVLLNGVTGSGKTEIYIQLIRETLEQGKQVLFLVPEIALTTQLITRIRAVFGEIVGVYHSRFSENERVEIWNNVLSQGDASGEVSKQYRVILGARSALFLPYQHLGLIIVDEEHENSFKQHDPSPRYHARDAALYLATLHKAKVLLGSATPSLESWNNALQGKYSLIQLKEQFVKGGGTEVSICDLRFFEQSQQMKTSLTPPLFEAIKEALEKKEQVILFQNRRGFAPYTECKQCGFIPHCTQCDVSLIYHKHNDKLNCHYCGYTIPPLKVCTACGSHQLHFKGLGTEKIEEDIETLFPEAKVARMDLDSTRSKYAYKQLIDDFEQGSVDILIGTQMVTKGLDFQNVTVVGILNADSMLNYPDFRSYEKAYQLITQVRGRAGRNNKTGKVYVQTSQPAHTVIDQVINGSIGQFYKTILLEREEFKYPPYSRLFELTLTGKDLNEVNHLANELLLLLKPFFGANIIGPEFPLISKIKNKYLKCLLIKTERNQSPQKTRTDLYEAINELHDRYKKWDFRVQIDVDPV